MTTTAMQRSPNKDFSQFLLIGNPENRRITGFCEAAQRLGYGQPTVLSYMDLLSESPLPSLLPGTIVKIDSPGENDTVRKLLIFRGLSLHKPSYPGIQAAANSTEVEEKGLIRHTRPWYAGYCDLLDGISRFLRGPSPLLLMNDIGDIRLAFDKPRCQSFLQQHDIPVPLLLPPVRDYDDLVTQMQQHHLSRVFIKPAHASSASGVIAFRRMGHRVQAVTSAKMVAGAEGIQVYNSLAIQKYTREQDIARLVNRILEENALVEEWLPKASLNDSLFDIRVLVIAGKARHMVVRMSRHPITNLHLGNKRGDLQELVARIGQQPLLEVRALAEKTAACFPHSLYLGIDILLTSDLLRTFVLEVNAFGDLLPRLVDEGETCYEAEIRAAIRIFMHPTESND